MKEFDGKVALVTGGGSGIGRATALAFARDGAKVVIADRNAQRGEEIVSTIRDAGGIASFRRTDVSVAAEIESLVDYTMKTYGRLDLAFNNAGIEGDVKPLVDQTEANFDAVMDINVKGVWLSMKYEIPRMLEQGGGAIVNSSSVAGVVGFPADWDLCCVETCRDRSDENRCVGIFRARDSHQRGQSGRDRHRDDRSPGRWLEYEKG